MEKQSVGHWWRTLRPLFWWMLIVLGLFGFRENEKMMNRMRVNFAVVNQGNEVTAGADARLDGRPITSGQKFWLGKHTLTIGYPKANDFTANFDGHYGAPQDFGPITLQRSTGQLLVSANPPAQRITINGSEASVTLNDVASTNLVLPTDTYLIQAEYPRWSQRQKLAVSANAIAPCTFAPPLGALHLTGNREGATYVVQDANGQNVENGTLPATVTGLVAGNYQIVGQYHLRPMIVPTRVIAGTTNYAPLEFVLGGARLESLPAGADVRAADGSFLGRTPLVVPDLPPPTARFDLSLSGYEPASVTVEVVAEQTNSCQTNLLSLSYGQAVRAAKAQRAAANFSAVLVACADALAIKPDDAEILALQSEAKGVLGKQAEALQVANQQEAIAQAKLEQLKRPKLEFDKLCAQSPDATLFEQHELTAKKPAKELVAALTQAMQSPPRPFEESGPRWPDGKTYTAVWRQTFSMGLLGGMERHCLLVVGEASDGETQVWFKILEYQVKSTLVANNLNVQQQKQMTPISPSRMQMDLLLENRIKEGVKMVTDKIQTAISQ